jgi:hypothetical protein
MATHLVLPARPDGVPLCGACGVLDGVRGVMVLCTPERCGEEEAEERIRGAHVRPIAACE